MNAGEIIDHEARALDVDAAEVIGPRQFPALVEARRRVAVRLHALGWSTRAIGRELRRDHSTVIDLLRKPAPDVAPTPHPSPMPARDGTPQ